MKKEPKGKSPTCSCCSSSSGNSFWGWCFLVVGVYFLAAHFGIVPMDFPFWSIVAILIGLYLLNKKK